MAMTRRRVLALLGSTATVLAQARALVAEPFAGSMSSGGLDLGDDTCFAAFADKLSPDFGVGPVADGTDACWANIVETRLHGGAVCPRSHELVVVARRPGSCFLVIDARSGGLLRSVEASPGRHFYGHAVFSADGCWLFTTEADYEAGVGLIGVYDVTRGYSRTAEWASGGVGPHELVLTQDGGGLWVANGGVDTHPDGGRAMLNEGTLQSTLVRLDLSGKLAASYDLGPDLDTLSIRHIAVTPDGALVFGCQDQADVAAARPLVGVVSAAGRCEIVEAGRSVWPALNGYVGSVAVDSQGRYLAATSPRGNQVLFQAVAGGEQTSLIALEDVCGVAALSRPGAFLVTSGAGEIARVAVSAEGARITMRARANRRWDNHIIRASWGRTPI